MGVGVLVGGAGGPQPVSCMNNTVLLPYNTRIEPGVSALFLSGIGW